MRFFLLMLFFVLLSLFLQSTLLQALLPHFLVPQLTILPVVFLAFTSISFSSTAASFLIGLLVDISSAVLLGPYAGGYVATYGLIAVISQRLFIESRLVAALVSGFASILADILFVLISYEFRPLNPSVGWDILSRGIVTALIGPVILFFMYKFVAPKNSGRLSSVIVG